MNVADDDAVTSPINVVLELGGFAEKITLFFCANHGPSKIHSELVTGVPATVPTVWRTLAGRSVPRVGQFRLEFPGFSGQ